MFLHFVGRRKFLYCQCEILVEKKKCQKFGHLIMSLFSQSRHCTFLTQVEQVGYLKYLLPLGYSQWWNSITGIFVQLWTENVQTVDWHLGTIPLYLKWPFLHDNANTLTLYLQKFQMSSKHTSSWKLANSWQSNKWDKNET